MQVWTVCSAYHLTYNAKNMSQWKQRFGCFVWGRKKKNKKTPNYKVTHIPLQSQTRHRPDTHHSQQSYLVTLGNDNIPFSSWSSRSEETSALPLNSFDIEKSEGSRIPPCSGCHLGAVIIIQRLRFLRMTPVDKDAFCSEAKKINKKTKLSQTSVDTVSG